LWSIPIAMSFPPGSLTVISSRHEEILKDVVVPTFNATDVCAPELNLNIHKSQSMIDI
jgi:hypothetical protein